MRIRGSQLLALPEQAKMCPREGERQEERTDGGWQWEEVQVDVGTVPCAGQHVWARLKCWGAAHRVCEHAMMSENIHHHMQLRARFWCQSTSTRFSACVKKQGEKKGLKERW